MSDITADEAAGMRAEMREMRAENGRLRRDLEIWRRNGGDILQRAEVERLELEVAAWKQASDLKAVEIERLNTGIYTLSIENERLRRDLENVVKTTPEEPDR